jgi:putative ABC transport system permease protein
MMLALRDIRRKRGRFIATSTGVGLLLGVVMIQAGIYRGVVADALAVPNMVKADLWVVSPDRYGPFTETTTVFADARDDIARIAGVRQASLLSFTFGLADVNGRLVRTDVVGYQPMRVPLPGQLVAGRGISKPRYEAVVDRTLGVGLGERIKIRDRQFDVVGLVDRAVGITGKPVTFVSLADARIVESKVSPPQIRRQRAHGQSGDVQPDSASAIIVHLEPGADLEAVKQQILRWKHFNVITGPDQAVDILNRNVDRVRDTLFLFAVILLMASAAIVALTIYSMTTDKLREIAVLKLIGAGNRVICSLIIWQSLAIGIAGFVIAIIFLHGVRGIFPGYMEITLDDTIGIGVITVVACLLASVGGVRIALRVPPNQALAG